MPKCPFATWDEITGPVGAYAEGPFKIVHHTTEGTTYASARAAYRANKSDPHFTVVGEEVYQHVDTGLAARSLKNPPGGVETNRDSAVQIEVVAFAGQPKDPITLKTVAKLCRWIESEHAVEQRWPNGRPRWSTNGNDPGGHNRTPSTWDNEGGHYGHSQVPENSHWDPGYTPVEVAMVTPEAIFDPHDELERASITSAREADTLVPGESAETIAGRVLAALASSPPPERLGRLRSIQIRVVSRDVEVSVVLEGDAQESAPVASARKGRRRRAPRRAGRVSAATRKSR
jgi:hypothetical protein